MLPTINARMREIRITLNLTQEQMGKSLGMTQSAYGAIEIKAKGVSGPVLLLLQILYNINTEFLLKGGGEMFFKKSKNTIKGGQHTPESMQTEIEINVLREQVKHLNEKNSILNEMVDVLKQADKHHATFVEYILDK